MRAVGYLIQSLIIYIICTALSGTVFTKKIQICIENTVHTVPFLFIMGVQCPMLTATGLVNENSPFLTFTESKMVMAAICLEKPKITIFPQTDW